jgi:hypothetical protein
VGEVVDMNRARHERAVRKSREAREKLRKKIEQFPWRPTNRTPGMHQPPDDEPPKGAA